MTNTEFIDTVARFYGEAKHRTGPFALPGVIKRSRSHSISALTEDLLAYFIAQRCNLSNHQLLVDYPISFHSEAKKESGRKTAVKTIYPDIALVEQTANGPVIKAIVDLKMDLGWMRELDHYLQRQLQILEELKAGGTAWCKEIDDFGVKATDTTGLLVSGELQLHVVVVSAGNISQAGRVQNQIHADADCYKGKIRTYVFAEGHANSDCYKVNDEEMNRFVNQMKNAQ